METLGIVHEYKLKSLIYSPFGRQILTSVVRPQALREYLTAALSFDVMTNVDLVLGAIAQQPDVSAVLVTENDRYVGLLDTAGIIKTMHDRLLAGARDANPLSKLPGNERIAEHMLTSLESGALPLGFVYLDFDNFKPFNDRFGFRTGDRAIGMFADALRVAFGGDDVFLGHIGGDDFFVGTTGAATISTFKSLPNFIAGFAKTVAGFYDETSRRNGATRWVAWHPSSFGQWSRYRRPRGATRRRDRRDLAAPGAPQDACEAVAHEIRIRIFRRLGPDGLTSARRAQRVAGAKLRRLGRVRERVAESC
jgi:GGDEF domain-containing protein